MTGNIHGNAVYHLLDGKVFDFAEMFRVAFLIDSYDAAGTGSIDAPQAAIKLDYICTRRKRKVSHGTMVIQRKHGHRSAFSAEQKGTAPFGIDSHSMVELATLDRILAQYPICCRIDLSNVVCAAQIDVDLPRGRIVLGHPGFAIESQSLDDFALVDINDSHSFAECIGDIDFPKRRRIGASVRLRGCGQPLHD